MSSIKTTIKLETTTLFPSPVIVTVPITEQVNGDADFSVVIVEADSDQTIFQSTAADASGVVYFYIQSIPSNVGSIDVYITDQSTAEVKAFKVIPGDFVWFPLAVDAAGIKVRIDNPNLSNDAKINYFYGERA